MSAGAKTPAATLLLIGCGKMGQALLKGWLDRNATRHVVVVEPGTGADHFANDRRVERRRTAETVDAAFVPDAIVLAVKPQILTAVLPAYKRLARTSLFLSIAAGKTLAYFAREIGEGAAVVRAMPNTPAAIGRGITVACANPLVSDPQHALAERLLASVGEVAWIEQEGLMDAVTAVSGSGPAYVFLLIECLAKAGITAGLPDTLALRLAHATVTGSGELARLASESAAKLREHVTSPGGTTRAALDVLMGEGGLESLMIKAVEAAARRSRQLAD